MKDFLSIQEFSKLSGVEITTLRYWDDIGLFSPIKRDPENNYRCYSLEQITALNFVTTLSDLGVPLKTIAELRKNRDADNILRVLESKERDLDMELRTIRIRSSIIHSRRELIRLGLNIEANQISVAQRQNDRAAILWPRNKYNEGDTFLGPLTSMINEALSLRINLGFPIGGRYDSMETFIAAPNCPQNFFSIDPTGTNTRKSGEYLIGYINGNYGELGDLPERMQAYAKENNLKITG
ncbi:MAG: MerR family transcriptional regulator, partial [Oscillospiraceae bacterium]|nr:MerR family transcriptional regulator [Oscillospiraceae bacterium]